jgi:hypothetical protein
MNTTILRANDVRKRLLDLHKALIDAERLIFERQHGRQTPGAFLDLLVNEQSFAWLRPWTALIVRLDEAVEEPPEGADARERAAARSDCLRAIAALIDVQPEVSVNERYAHLLQHSADVLIGHRALQQALAAASIRAPT